MNPQMRMRLANKGKGEFRADANTIWLYDAIASDAEEAMWFGGIAPADFIAMLADTTGPVTLRVNSPGGSVFGAQAMVAAMRQHPHAITAQIDSLAASAASIIAVECASCVMAPGSMMMIHKAWGLAVGNSDEMIATANLLAKIDGQLAESYTRKAGGAADFAQLMADETWLTAEEAVALGLADGVVAENTQRPAARWDLSAFAKAPKDDPLHVTLLVDQMASLTSEMLTALIDKVNAEAVTAAELVAIVAAPVTDDQTRARRLAVALIDAQI